MWAKVRGCPWWPAVVVVLPNQEPDKLLVNFVGDNSHATLPLSQIQPFAENDEAHSKSKIAKLLDSIRVAERIHSNATTYIGMLSFPRLGRGEDTFAECC